MEARRKKRGAGRGGVMWCWHKWGKWGDVIESYGGSQHQVCQCEKCGAIKRRLAISIFRAQLNPKQIMDSLKALLASDTKG